MTVSEFNRKWSNKTKPGFYGLAIDNPDIIYFLDKRLISLSKNFKDIEILQIKTKFGIPRVYIDNIPSDEISRIEKEIAEILKKSN